MAALTPDDMAAKLLADGFERNGPVASALTDPIADTPMVVTLDQLRPYELNPRVTRNPATTISKRRSASADWMRHQQLRAGRARRITSFATEAIHAWRF